jgi:outer membrane lipoprotein-sorting protein
MKIKIALTVLAVVFAFVAVGQEKAMNTSEIAAFKAAVLNESKSIKTLSSDFVQYKHVSFMSRPVESSGKMFLKSPNMLAWKYVEPASYSTIFKNNKMYVDNQGKKSNIDLGANRKFEQINEMIIGSISGNMFNSAAFDVSYFKDGKQQLAKFVPKSKELKKYMKQVVLYFDINHQVKEVKLIEPTDDFTRLVFKNRVVNGKVDDSVFNN